MLRFLTTFQLSLEGFARLEATVLVSHACMWSGRQIINFFCILTQQKGFGKTESTELALEFRQFLFWRNPTSSATTIPKKRNRIGGTQKRMRGGEARAERHSRSGRTRPRSGCWVVTEFK